MKGSFRNYILPGVLLFFLILVFWSLTFGYFPKRPGDFSHNVWNYYLPQYEYTFSRLRHGELPLWNPYQACGVPVLATLQPGVFYPPNWLYCFADVTTGLKWLSVFHLLWAGFWLMLIYRELFPNSTVSGSMVAAAAFVFSGFLPWQIWWPGNLYAASWLPCLLFFGERLTQTRSWKWAVLLSVAVAFSFLAGFTQYAVYMYVFLCGFVLIRVWQLYIVPRMWRKSLIVLLLQGLAAAIALLLVSPQMLPTMELIRLSERTPGALSLAGSMVTPAEGYSLKTLLHGVFFPSAGASISFFILLGAVVSFSDKSKRALILFFGSAGLLALIISLGTNTFLYSLYFKYFPTGNWFTTPLRWRLIVLFCVCLIGTHGVDLLTDHSRQLFGPHTVKHSLWFLLIPGLAVLMFVGYCYAGGISSTATFGNRAIHWADLYFPAQIVALIAFVFLARQRYVPRTVLKMGIISIIFVEAVFVHRYSQTFPCNDNMPYDMAAIDFLRANAGIQRVHLENNGNNARTFPEKLASMFHFYATTDWEPLTLLRYRNFILAMQGNEEYGHFQLTSRKMLFTLFNLLSVKYIVISDGAPDIFQLPEAQRPFLWSNTFPEPEFPLVAQSDNFKIYENPSCLPRVLFSPRFTICTDEALPFLCLSSLRDPQVDPVRQPIVDAAPDLTTSATAQSNAAEGSQIKVTLMASERMKCSVNTGRSGIFWTTDAYYPGWKVKVDGKEARLLKVNYLFRGVALSAGKHDVEFRYECQPLRLAALLFACGLLIILLGSFLQRIVSLRKDIS